MKTRLPLLLAASLAAALPIHAQPGAGARAGAPLPPAPTTPYAPKAPESATLKDTYKNLFYIGAAVRPDQVNGQNAQASALLLKDFNSIVAENEMKMGPIHPRPGNDDSSYNFTNADAIVDFGVKNGMFVIGHNLCWHSQMPAWFTLPDGMAPPAPAGRGGARGGAGGGRGAPAPAAQLSAPPALDALKTALNLTDTQAGQISPLLAELAQSYADTTAARGRSTAATTEVNARIAALLTAAQKPAFEALANNTVTKEVLMQRLKDHVFKVAGRYKGKVNGWDVVNEALADNAGQTGGLPMGLRNDSPFNRIIGPEYLVMVFKWAHEAAPDAELYYNDYNLDVSDFKRANAVALVKYLKENGAPIHGVGMQGHYSLAAPSTAKIDETIKMFAALGVKVMITELDVTVNTNTNVTGAVGANPGAPAGGGRRGGGAPVLNDDQQYALAKRYGEIFAVFLANRASISRVTFWGLRDTDSWRAENSPLLYDVNYGRKPAYDAVIHAVQAAGLK